MNDGTLLVRLERRGDGEVGSGVLFSLIFVSFLPLSQQRRERKEGGTYPVENVDQLALLHGANHDSTSFRIRREVLTRDDPPRTGTAIRFLMKLLELVGRWLIFEDDYPTRIGADDDVV